MTSTPNKTRPQTIPLPCLHLDNLGRKKKSPERFGIQIYNHKKVVKTNEMRSRRFDTELLVTQKDNIIL